MKYLCKGLIILLSIINIVQGNLIHTRDIILMLLIISTTVLIESMNKKGRLIVLFIETFLIGYAYIFSDISYSILCILLFDAVYSHFDYLIIIIPGFMLYQEKSLMHFPMDYWLSIILVGIIAFLLRKNEAKQTYYNNILDNERRIRYDLEITKNQLLLSNKAIEKLTVVKERNRIARDLHDNVGHSIAGILIQLQAAQRLMKNDLHKSEHIINQCIKNLQISLGTIRDTVHNMYHTEKVGIDYIKKIIDGYTYCKVILDYKGDFSKVLMKHLEIFGFIVKEALTNASKYSNASEIQIELMVNDKLLRLSIKDNGMGCPRIKEGLGMKSMKDRIKNIGGTIAIDGSHGMIIVCTIPQ